MKKMLIKTMLPAIMLLATSCDSLLDLAPEDTLTEERAFESEKSVESIIAGTYHSFYQALLGQGTTYYAGFIMGDETTDALHLLNNNNSFVNATFEYDDQSVKDIWAMYYKAVNNANVIISNIPRYAKYNQVIRNRQLAETYFIRAYLYFDLLKFFGDGALLGQMQGLGLPLQLMPYNGYDGSQIIPRSTNEQVYAQIIKDLEFSIANLPSTYGSDQKNGARATKLSASALLSRVYLYKRDYTQAAKYAKDVIDGGVYSLSTFSELFPYNEKGKFIPIPLTKEHVFALPVSSNGSQNGQYNGNNLGSGYYYKNSYWIEKTFIRMHEKNDQRVTMLMYLGFYDRQIGDSTTFKFNNSDGRDNVPLIRYSEVLLTRAEALVRENGVNVESVALLNQVRGRAILSVTPLTTADFPNSQELLNRILKERYLELAFEGQNRYDLIRTGRLLKNKTLPDNKKVLPIPQSEVEISKGIIKQNPGFL
jgi:hypothetical protein